MYHPVMDHAVDLQRLRAALLRWYRRDRRAMPWRAEPGDLADPYHVLLSEFMLQQTQVVTVAAYFEPFLEALPTLEALASASEQRVLRLWQGLGYYRRARSLHRAAQAIVRDHGGEVPATVDELMRLPGIGRYTAGAVASIAFGAPAPVVDGNVARVLGRLLGERKAVDDPVVVKHVWAVMGDLVRTPCRLKRQPYGPGDVNQAMMELGATVCLPRGPRCLCCPIRACCAAYSSGEPEAFGAKGKRAAPKDVVHRVAAIRRGDRWLFEQRGGDGLWAGMWQLTTLETETCNSEPATSKLELPRRLEKWVRERFGLEITALQDLGAFAHQTTHRRIRFEVYAMDAIGGRLQRGAGVWRRLDRINELPISNAQKRVVAIIQARDA